MIADEEEITQLVAPVTVADSVTDPPLSGSAAGEDAKLVIVGAGTAADAGDAPTTANVPRIRNRQVGTLNASMRPLMTQRRWLRGLRLPTAPEIGT